MFGGISTKRTDQQCQHVSLAHFRKRGKPRRGESSVPRFHVRFPVVQALEQVGLVWLPIRGTVVANPARDAMLAAHVLEKVLGREVHLVGSLAVFVDAYVRKYILSDMSPVAAAPLVSSRRSFSRRTTGPKKGRERSGKGEEISRYPHLDWCLE